MKIVYVTNSRIPTEKAHGVNIMEMCQALAEQGIKVKLILPKRKNDITADPFIYYHLPENFEIQYVNIIDLIGKGRPYAFAIAQACYALKILFSNKLGEKNKTIILAREHIPSLLLKWRGYKVFHDLHGFPVKKFWFWKYFLIRMDGIIATNRWKKEQCVTKFNIADNKIIVAPNGFNLKLFKVDQEKNELRKALAMPLEKKIAVYAGHLYDWKGAQVLASSAKYLPEVLFYFIGGTGNDIKDFKDRFGQEDNIRLIGHIAHDKIPKYLKSADVLVLPNSKKAKDPRFVVYSQFDSSPIKMFEYMASGTPIVASRLPSIQEILNNNNSILVEPDNPENLAQGIKEALNNESLALKISQQARLDAEQYSWDKRATKIINFIKEKT